MILWLTLLGSQSYAAGENADIELLFLNISPRSIPGIDSTLMKDFGHLYLSSQLQYIRDPLVLYADNSDRGAIVGEKATLNLAGAFDFSERISLQARLPVVVQWGSDNPTLTRTGLGFGDLNITGRIRTYQNDWIDTAARVALFIPTGSKNAWISELQPRAQLGILAQSEIGDFDVLSEVSLMFREAVNTDKDFVLGNEIVANIGGRWNLWPDQFSFGSTLLTRWGMVNLFRGGAETSIELVNFMQVHYNDEIIWEAGLGKGITSGYGTAEIRGFVNLHYKRRSEKPEPVYKEPPLIEPEPIVDIPPPKEPEPPEEPVFQEEELAKVQDDQIYIRDAIQFKVGTDSILPMSLPTLEFVAGIINQDIKIGHLVIEGHASEEGEFTYNYDLSNLRARAIYRALVDAGVHPDRMSYRGFGEALPRVAGNDEASLAKNRRVEFHIVRQDPDYGPLPPLREIKISPWNGTPLQSIIPKLKPKPKEEKPEDKNDIFDPDETEEFKDIDFDLEEDDAPPSRRGEYRSSTRAFS